MVTIIDYKAGNLTSVKLALDQLGAGARITSDPALIRNAERIIFPGVGAAASAMATLDSLGVRDALRDVLGKGVPFLGICLGCQILLDESEEDGGVQTLGLVPGKCVKFRSADPRDKVPEMGWNQVSIASDFAKPFFTDIPDGSEFYFVHSYYPAPADADDVVAHTEYAGVRFASMFGRDNLIACQFHPEKSGRIGLQLLKNFLFWQP